MNNSGNRALISVHCLSQSSPKSIKFMSKNDLIFGPRSKTKHTNQQKIYQHMQRKSSILGPNIVDFGTHFDISSFPGPNMQHTLIFYGLSFLEKPRNIIIYYVLETPQKPVLAREREARFNVFNCSLH